MEDLWPENLVSAKERMPVEILRDQAVLLGQKTRNLLEGRVKRIEPSDMVGLGDFAWAFSIVSPALGNYSYRLFAIRYGADVYPVTFDVEEVITQELPTWAPKLSKGNNRTLLAHSEAEFIEVVRAILGSERTRKLIAAILAQVTDPTDRPSSAGMNSISSEKTTSHSLNSEANP